MVTAAKIELLDPTSTPATAKGARRAKRSLRTITHRPEDYVGLVKRVAYQMARRLPSRVDVRDLIGSGTIGLLDAIAKYDPKQNDNFEAYAEIRIRGAILDELRGLDWVPRSVRQKSHLLERVTRGLEGELGRAPTDEECAKAMSLSMEDYFGLVNDVRAVTMLSLEDLIGAGTHSGGGALGPAEATEETALEQLCRRATASAVAGAIEELPERERLVLSLYYLEGLKLKDIGEILGVTESRVCQIHGHAIHRLRGLLSDAV